jgi:NADP-dependent 3-hydroxy acid dehydrogenase YdfG
MGSLVAVITGGAQGIGKQTAQVMNDLGWSLVLVEKTGTFTETRWLGSVTLR